MIELQKSTDIRAGRRIILGAGLSLTESSDGLPQIAADSLVGTIALDDLSDVTITTPATGQMIRYNGSVWVNSTDGSALTALNATNISTGNLAYARLPTGGGTWSNGGSLTIQNLSSTISVGLKSWGGTATLLGQRADGTSGSESAVQASEDMLTLTAQGYDGSVFQSGASLSFQTSEIWSGSARGSLAYLLLTKPTTTGTLRFATWNGNGLFTWGSDILNATGTGQAGILARVGTNAGANNQDAYFEANRGGTSLWREGVLGSLVANTNWTLRDVVNSISVIIATPSTTLPGISVGADAATANRGAFIAVNAGTNAGGNDKDSAFQWLRGQTEQWRAGILGSVNGATLDWVLRDVVTPYNALRVGGGLISGNNGVTTANLGNTLSLNAGTNGGTNDKDAAFSVQVSGTEKWRFGILGSVAAGVANLRLRDVVNSVTVLSANAGSTAADVRVLGDATTANVDGQFVINAGTNSGANGKDARLIFQRGGTELFRMGILGAIGTEDAFRLREVPTGATLLFVGWPSTASIDALLRLNAGTAAGANSRDSYVENLRGQTSLWKSGVLGSVETTGRWLLQDIVNSIVSLEVVPGGGLKIHPRITAGAFNGGLDINNGTNAGANNQDVYVRWNRGGTALWQSGVLGSVSADGNWRLLDVTNTVSPLVAIAGADAVIAVAPGFTTANANANIRINSGTNSGANDKDAYVGWFRGGTELWRLGQLGSTGTTAQLFRLRDIVNSIIVFSAQGAAASGTLSLVVCDSITTGNFNAKSAVNAGTNSGANDKDSFFEWQRGQTALWRGGILGSQGANGNWTLRDVANSVNAMVVTPGATPLLTIPQLTVSSGGADITGNATVRSALIITGGASPLVVFIPSSGATKSGQFQQVGDIWSVANFGGSTHLSIDLNTSVVTFNGDISIGTLGVFDHTDTPTPNQMLVYKDGINKWQAESLILASGNNNFGAKVLADGTAAAYVLNDPGVGGAGAQNAPGIPVVAVGHLSFTLTVPAGYVKATNFRYFNWQFCTGTGCSGWVDLGVQSTSMSIVHSRLTAGTIYRYRVQAVSRDGASVVSSTTTADQTAVANSDVQAFGGIIAGELVAVDLTALVGDIGILIAGQFRGASNLFGINFGGKGGIPVTWNAGINFENTSLVNMTRYMNFNSSAGNAFMKHERFEFNHDGSVRFYRNVAFPEFNLDASNFYLQNDSGGFLVGDSIVGQDTLGGGLKPTQGILISGERPASWTRYLKP
jgi:hypothetical protein